MLQQVEVMYSHPMDQETFDSSRGAMTGFYLFNNAGIGLRCFASGIFLGVGSLVTLAFNAIFLGTIFGHMLRSPSSINFITFVTAHGPFELTAVVLSAAAGLRLGWAIIDTNGCSRRESLRKTAPQALETAGVATMPVFVRGLYWKDSFRHRRFLTCIKHYDRSFQHTDSIRLHRWSRRRHGSGG